MSTLRDLVHDNEIHFHENRDYYAIDKFNGESGVMGNNGPALKDAFYKVKHAFVKSNTEFIMDYKMSFERRYETQGEYYPIIMTTINTDESNPYSFGNLAQVGEKNQDYYGWWGPDGYYGNANYGLNDYWGIMRINSSGGYFDSVTYDLSQGNEGAVNTKIGFDAMAKEDPVNPQYNLTIGNFLNNELRTPPYLAGPARMGNREYWDIFSVEYTPLYYESTPRIDEIDTNIPVLVFDNAYYSQHGVNINQKVLAYTTDGDLSRFAEYIQDEHAIIVNTYRQPTTQGVKTFSCYSDIYQGTWGYAGVEDETFVGYRYLQVFVKPSLTAATPRVTLIKDPTPTELRARLKVYGDIEKVRYSTDGGNSWSESDSLPWEYLYYKRTNELGELKYDQNHGGNILLFASEALSDDGADYLAEDYAEKSQYYPSTNTSGTEETSTTMGVTTLNSFFQRMYIVDKADMAIISSALYDTDQGGIWEDIKKGIEMFGENPIDCVAGLCYFPLDLTQVFRGASPASSVFFGGYQLSGVSCYELMNYNGYVDIGTMEIKESFPHGSYRNYEPYTALKIWLPFIGLKELHLNKYIGKTLAIRYYFDCFNGGCMAVLFSDGLVADIFDGMAGVQIPISLTDFAGYAAAQIQNFTELGSSAVAAVAPLTGGASMSSLIGAAAGAGNYEQALFKAEQTTTSDFNSTKGASSAMINQYLPNYVYIIFEIIEEDETRLLSELMGKPSNASGTLGSFSGYLEVDEVELKTSAGMTEAEKNNFISLLHNGIII